MMNTRKAIDLAKRYATDIFSDETILDLGLEEIEFNEEDQSWRITVGFSRPWDQDRAALAMLGTTPQRTRTYKIVEIRDADGSLVSLKNRTI